MSSVQSMMYQNGVLRLAPESTNRSTGRLMIQVGDQAQLLEQGDAVELAIAILDHITGAVPDESLCGSCHKPIMWIQTVNGRPAPVDPRRLQITSEDGTSHYGYESHFASCTTAKEHRTQTPKDPTPIRPMI